MTDTIGWGDVDVEPASPRRRRRRGLLLWLGVSAVVAGIAIAPVVKGRLADSSAKWLAREWRLSQAYDASRSAVEDHGLLRATPGDALMYQQLVSLLDREEASRLRRLARDIAGHHTWRSDVHSAATTVRRALVAESRDLDTDAGRTTTTFRSGLFLETPTQPTTQSLLLTAQRAVEQLAHRHHVRPSELGPTEGRLTSGATVLAELDRITNTPLNLRLAISNSGTLDVWDLASGHHLSNPVIGSADSYWAGTLVRVGRRVLYMTDGGPVLVGDNGRTSARLPGIYGYVPAGEDAIWAELDQGFRRYDASGRPVGPFYVRPPGFSANALAATSDSLVLVKDTPYAGTESWIWTPHTARLVRLTGSCDASVSGSGDAIAYVSCDQHAVSVIDVPTGKIHRIPAPAGTTVDQGPVIVSSDGKRIAFSVSPLNGNDRRGRVVVSFVGTGESTELPAAGAPLSWSPDGTTLLLNNYVLDNESSSPLDYWRDGMGQPAPIRIRINTQSLDAVLLP